MRRKQPEAEIQRAVCQHLEARAVPGLVWWAVPNGGFRSKAEAAIMSGLGVKPGVSDLIFLHNNRFFALELKALGKKPNEKQEQFMFAVIAQGGLAWWADNIDDAIKWLEHFGLLRGVSQGKAA